MWPVENMLPEMAEQIKDAVLPALEKGAAEIAPGTTSLVALDWLNGRRTPDSNQKVKGAITGLTLGTTAPMIYRTLIDATAFGTKAIIDRFKEEGVTIKAVRAIGGISQKSKLVMQIMSDVIGMPVSVVDCDQACALGAGMLAAAACGIYPDVTTAQEAMGAPVGCTFQPDMAQHEVYEKLYAEYVALGTFVEKK